MANCKVRSKGPTQIFVPFRMTYHIKLQCMNLGERSIAEICVICANRFNILMDEYFDGGG